MLPVSYQVMLLLITGTFSQCLVGTSSCKICTITQLWSKTSKPRGYEIDKPQALSSALTLLGHHRSETLCYKFRRPLAFEFLTII